MRTTVADLLLPPVVSYDRGMEDAMAVYERFKPTLPVGDPVAFFRQATIAGCPALTVYRLLRDFWNLSLRECRQVEINASDSATV